MLTEVISLNDGAVARTYQLVSRIGMDSIRRETTAATPATAQSMFVVKHTIDAKKPSKPNRHLVSLTYSEITASGLPAAVTVHAVITRNKLVSDGEVLKQAEMLANFLGEPANVSKLLIGGN